MKSATLGFLCYKSCSSVPRLDSCRGKRIVSISQAGSWADRDSPHIRARSLVGALLVYLGSSGFKNVLFYKADLVRGCLIANTSLCYVRQASACFGVCWGCAQQQGEEKDFSRADGRWQSAVVGHIEGRWQVCWDQPRTKKQTPLHISNFLYLNPLQKHNSQSCAGQQSSKLVPGRARITRNALCPIFILLSSSVMLLENKNCLNNGADPMKLCSDAEGVEEGLFLSFHYFSPPALPPKRGWNLCVRRQRHQPGPVAFLNGKNEIKCN